MEDEFADEGVRWVDLIDENKQVRVHSQRCGTCVAWEENRMSLEEGRKEELFADAAAADGFVACHQTLDYSGYGAPPAICHAYYLDHRNDVWPLRLARMRHAIAKVKPPCTTWNPPHERTEA